MCSTGSSRLAAADGYLVQSAAEKPVGLTDSFRTLPELRGVYVPNVRPPAQPQIVARGAGQLHAWLPSAADFGRLPSISDFFASSLAGLVPAVHVLAHLNLNRPNKNPGRWAGVYNPLEFRAVLRLVFRLVLAWLAQPHGRDPHRLDVVLAVRGDGKTSLRNLQMKTSMIFSSGSSMPP